MSGSGLSAFLKLVSGTRGHFLLESGLHGALWLDLDPLFDDGAAVTPFIDALAQKISLHNPDIVCGPAIGGAVLAQRLAKILGVDFYATTRQQSAEAHGLFAAQYTLPDAARSRVHGRRVAIVDDVMSAGSSLRATLTELERHQAQVVAAGALLVLGDKGFDFFEKQNIPVEYTNRDAYEFWEPSSCPMCAAGTPLVSR